MQVDLYSLQMSSQTTGWGLILGLDKWANGVVTLNGEYRVIHTNDGGVTFQGVKTWKLDTSDHLEFFPLSEQMALAFTSQQVYRTTNAGTTWEEGSLPLISDERIWVRSLTFPDANSGWVLLQIGHTSSVLLLSTTDGGLHWKQVLRFTNEIPPVPGIGGGSALQFLDRQTGWITAIPTVTKATTQKPLLYLTRDGGYTWTPQPLLLPPGIKPTCELWLEQPRFFSAQEGVLPASINHSQDGTPNGFLSFVTHDGGLSWQSRPFVAVDYNVLYTRTVKPGAIHQMAYRNTPAPRFTDMGFGWVGHPDLALFTTTDGGMSWQPLVSPSPFKEASQLLFLSSKLGWIITKSEDEMTSSLYKTSDGGTTWTLLPATLL